jgi:hypothetical protein
MTYVFHAFPEFCLANTTNTLNYSVTVHTKSFLIQYTVILSSPDSIRY